MPKDWRDLSPEEYEKEVVRRVEATKCTRCR